MRYAIVIEPGCVTTGDTIDETIAEIREAIAFHIEGMRAEGLPVPEPSSRVEYVEVST